MFIYANVKEIKKKTYGDFQFCIGIPLRNSCVRIVILFI